MRGIKFRLYNEEDNRMEQVTSITSFGPEGLICDSEFEGEESGWLGAQPVMQFTGLTDCNGVDIYTGDILKEKNRNVTWQVKHGEYELDSRFDSYQNQCVGFYVERITSLPSDTDCIGDTDWIVIGNIHQNPELLENNQ